MPTQQRPVKSSKAKARHAEVSKEFQKWLKKNPEATKKRRVETFDAYCDSAIMGESLENAINRKR